MDPRHPKRFQVVNEGSHWDPWDPKKGTREAVGIPRGSKDCTKWALGTHRGSKEGTRGTLGSPIWVPSKEKGGHKDPYKDSKKSTRRTLGILRDSKKGRRGTCGT